MRYSETFRILNSRSSHAPDNAQAILNLCTFGFLIISPPFSPPLSFRHHYCQCSEKDGWLTLLCLSHCQWDGLHSGYLGLYFSMFLHLYSNINVLYLKTQLEFIRSKHLTEFYNTGDSHNNINVDDKNGKNEPANVCMLLAKRWTWRLKVAKLG